MVLYYCDENFVALITGGRSSGLLVIVERLASNGERKNPDRCRYRIQIMFMMQIPLYFRHYL